MYTRSGWTYSTSMFHPADYEFFNHHCSRNFSYASTRLDDCPLFFLLMHSTYVSDLLNSSLHDAIRQALHNKADILIEAVVIGNSLVRR
jgi:hypothetical protein